MKTNRQDNNSQFIEVEKVAYCIAFAHNVRTLMKKLGMSMETLSNAIDMPRPSLYRKMNNPDNFSLSELLKIAKVLNNQTKLNIFTANQFLDSKIN
jgi:predicted transcriptional regulator